MQSENKQEKKLQKCLDDLVSYYNESGRHALPWRKGITPYQVVVSEVMLQQTQVPRVVKYFKQWKKEFPNWKQLANAKQDKVLRMWQGLGYNNRALRLKRLAEVLRNEYHGRLPQDRETLLSLPGIGPYTAGAIQAFAFNVPTVFIETNIRTVLIYYFCNNKTGVHDNELYPILKQLLETCLEQQKLDPRHFYYALMDYGSYLKRSGVKLNIKSSHYTKQSKFRGSDREIRGQILKLLLEGSHKKVKLQGKLEEQLDRNITKDQLSRIIDQLKADGFVEEGKGVLYLKK